MPAGCKQGTFPPYCRILDDPAGTKYPNGLLPFNLKTAWLTPFVSEFDMPKKLRNETELTEAPDYENPEFEAVDLPEAEGGEEDEAEEEE